MKLRLLLLLLPILFLISACKDDEMTMGNDGDLTDIPCDPTDMTLDYPDYFPQLIIPANNPQTNQGFELGRFLFYDKKLSSDETMSCASCHLPELAFTDGEAVSEGVQGLTGSRSSMSLVNVGFFNNGLFWDGRSPTLEQQALLPVTDELELFEDWDNVIAKLKADEDYPTRFREAFCIDNVDEITKELATKAIAQFERALISKDSKYDYWAYQQDFAYEYTDAEQRGSDMFFDVEGPLPDAECGHCHGGPLASIGEFFNNGLDEVESLDDFEDKGLYETTNFDLDKGKFKAPTLRNVLLSAPYMHDGRFETIEEVIDHYNTGGHYASNLDANLGQPMGLTDSQKEDIIAFLGTMTDTVFINNPAYQNPFE